MHNVFSPHMTKCAIIQLSCVVPEQICRSPSIPWAPNLTWATSLWGAMATSKQVHAWMSPNLNHSFGRTGNVWFFVMVICICEGNWQTCCSANGCWIRKCSCLFVFGMQWPQLKEAAMGWAKMSCWGPIKPPSLSSVDTGILSGNKAGPPSGLDHSGWCGALVYSLIFFSIKLAPTSWHTVKSGASWISCNQIRW